MLVTALLTVLAATSLLASDDHDCSVVLELRSCSGAPKDDVRIAVVAQGVEVVTKTDSDGRARFDVCSDEIDEVRVYFIEGGDPVLTTPTFDEDDVGIVVVC